MWLPIIFIVLFSSANALPQWPGLPQIPGVPGLPGIPQIPGVPGLPGIPQIPGVPGLPGIPQIPGVPGLPGIPQLPGLPKLPQIPGVPGIPGLSHLEIAFLEDIEVPTSSSRIVSGQPAKLGQFPYQVRSRARIDQHKYSLCGGSIISETVVLTASHCVAKYDSFELGFGSIDANMPAVKMTSTKKIMHEDFNPSTLANDVALLFLPEKLEFTDNIAPIELPSYSQKDSSFEGRKAIASGHGKTGDNESTARMLMFVPTKIISNQECRKTYGSRLIRASTLCVVGWDNPNQATCQGDSGGPLAMYDDNIDERILVGVVSFNTKRGCEAKTPTAFARVSQFLDWINKNGGVDIRP